MEIEQTLPAVAVYEPKAFHIGFGSDLYGAVHVAAAYCGLNRAPGFYAGMWQHGWVPPWQQLDPALVTYNAPRTMACWVGRDDEESYLRGAGYKARAIGLPVVYTDPTAARRLPGSLLVMPNHAIPMDKFSKDSDEYVENIVQIAGRFKKVVACVSARCIEQGLWKPCLSAAGIEVIAGAGGNDANSLQRIRTLFETFEFVTTPDYGSHVAYALYFGAKVSLWGPVAEPLTKEYLLRDAIWARYPEAAEQYCSHKTVLKQEEVLGRFRVEPWKGIADRELGASMVGHDRKLSPSALRGAFRWGLRERTYDAAKDLIWTKPWRFVRSAQRVLRRYLDSPSTASRNKASL